jgi:hypothetical protein
MCISINKDVKKQIAPGLPRGWTFATGAGPKVLLISPTGVEFHSLDDALDQIGNETYDREAARLAFQSNIGGTVLWNDDQHFLIGKEYYHEWTDVHGYTRVIYGVITTCERDKLDVSYASFTVTYSQQSLEEVIRRKPLCECPIETSTKLSLEWALGGHMAFNSKLGMNTSLLLETHNISVSYRRWLTADMRTEELISQPDGTKLPQLILVWNGFRLVFNVRPSTIPNAGFGLFVECTSFVPGRTEFRLERGEMLDLGVYAPFRKDDLKEDCVILVKNLILGLKCEEWAFDTGPTTTTLHYDITDDWTGDLHDMAAHHVPAYVNECKLEDNPTVHAEHDPEGVVHYLLGLPRKTLIIPTDGTTSELFINYGPAYERIRIRKNYSFLPLSEQLAQGKSDRPGERGILGGTRYLSRCGSGKLHQVCDAYDRWNGHNVVV